MDLHLSVLTILHLMYPSRTTNRVVALLNEKEHEKVANQQPTQLFFLVLNVRRGETN
jgi:hypothetical protein